MTSVKTKNILVKLCSVEKDVVFSVIFKELLNSAPALVGNTRKRSSIDSSEDGQHSVQV
jgi:hypothetical protein